MTPNNRLAVEHANDGCGCEMHRGTPTRRDLDAFPHPYAIADVLGFRVVEVPSLPAGAEQMTDGRTIWVAWAHDQRQRGSRLFRAIAAALLSAQGAPRSEAAAYELAAKLAVPPELMRRVGLDETIRRQAWATECLIRWWWNAAVVE
jgi:hypothetical protein